MVFVCHEKRFPGGVPAADPRGSKNDKCTTNRKLIDAFWRQRKKEKRGKRKGKKNGGREIRNFSLS